MITKIGKVFGTQLSREVMNAGRLEDGNAVSSYRNSLKNKAQEDKTKATRAATVGGLGGGLLGLGTSTGIKGGKAKLIGTGVGAAVGAGSGLLAKLFDDRDIERAKKMKDASRVAILRDIGVGRQYAKRNL